MWIVWNKTTFGKNMFAVGSNEEAANVSGVNVTCHHHSGVRAGGCYVRHHRLLRGRAHRLLSTANTGLNYECDAIAACVIGGVSFVGGIGKISRHRRRRAAASDHLHRSHLSVRVSQNVLYIIKGLIILVACAIDMRKYLVRK